MLGSSWRAPVCCWVGGPFSFGQSLRLHVDLEPTASRVLVVQAFFSEVGSKMILILFNPVVSRTPSGSRSQGFLEWPEPEEELSHP